MRLREQECGRGEKEKRVWTYGKKSSTTLGGIARINGHLQACQLTLTFKHPLIICWVIQ